MCHFSLTPFREGPHGEESANEIVTKPVRHKFRAGFGQGWLIIRKSSTPEPLVPSSPYPHIWPTRQRFHNSRGEIGSSSGVCCLTYHFSLVYVVERPFLS